MEKINKGHWKLYFFVLLGLVFGILSFLIFNVFNYKEEEHVFNPQIIEGEPSFQIKLTKDQTNELITHYFNEYQEDSKIKYSFAIENLFVLKGTFLFLGQDLNFYMYFEPSLEKNNVILKTKSVSIGTLNLPASEILRYVKSEYNFPKWVNIDYKNELIMFDFNNIEENNNYVFNVEKLDLINDDIIINVFLNK